MNSHLLRRVLMVIVLLLVVIVGTTAVTAAEPQPPIDFVLEYGTVEPYVPIVDENLESGPIKTVWTDPLGRVPMTFEEVKRRQLVGEPTQIEMKMSSLDLRETRDGSLNVEQGAAERPLVLALVNSNVYDGISEDLIQWSHDVWIEGWDVEIEKAVFNNEQDLRMHLASKHGLDSVLLIGDFPVPMFEVSGEPSFPIDLYYMDLDGIWSNKRNTAGWSNALDTHEGDIAPEISLGRLTAGPLTFGGDEVSLLKGYFADNRAYRTGVLNRPSRALNIVDNDWAIYTGTYDALELLYPGDVDRIANPWETSGQTYENVLEQPYEWLIVEAHASAFSQYLYPKGRFNFQPEGAWSGALSHPLPWIDSGINFGNAYSSRFGWNMDMTGRAHRRYAPNVPDYRYDTLIEMQLAQELEAVWEAEAPNGTYCVDELIAGDPILDNANFIVNIENHTVLTGRPTSEQRFVELTGGSCVEVNDGRITISSGAGARKNRLAYVDLRLANVSNYVSSRDIYEIGPESLFYNLFSCSSGSYIEDNYIAGWYIFSDGPGLAAVASTKSGSMLDFNNFYGPLAEGDSLGGAFKEWFAKTGINRSDWHYGMTLLGDPTLKMPKYLPGILVSPNREHATEGIIYAPADILKKDGSGAWSIHFDASDVGVPAAADLHAFTYLDDGSMLMTFDRSVILPGLAQPVTPWEVVRFWPTRMGDDTSGTFAVCPFDGANFLSTRGEKIDALHYADGALYLSTTGDYNIEQGSYWGFSGKDEDIIKVIPDAALCEGQGSVWEYYLYKNYYPVAGLASEDIQALWLDGQGQPHISLTNAFTINGVSGSQKDVLQLIGDENGDYDGAKLYWRGPDNGFYSAVDGLHIGEPPLPPEASNIEICLSHSGYPEEGVSIAFSGALGEFVLSDPGQECRHFNSLDTATYTIEGLLPEKWSVWPYCEETTGSGDAQWQHEQNHVSIDLATGSSVTCTFYAFYSPGDPFEPNDSMEETTSIQYGDAFEAVIGEHHEVEYHDDVDIFQFEGQAGDKVQVALTYWNDLYPSLVLMDSTGTSIAEVEPDWGASVSYLELVHVLPSSGTYYLLIKGNCFEGGFGCDGSYMLDLKKDLSAEQKILLSANRNDAAGGIEFTLGDISAADEADVWQMLFDASVPGVPVGIDLHAFSELADGSLLLVFDRSFTLPGTSTKAKPWDIIRFAPSQFGDYGAGAFSRYFDGSDVTLTATGEKIDALEQVDGDLYISVSGRFSTIQNGVKIVAEDEDILKFTPESLGEKTAGTWELFWDGSEEDSALAAEDMQSLYLDGAMQPYFSLINAFDCGGVPVNQKDIITYDTTGCRLVWHGPDHDFRSAIDGLHMTLP